MKKTIKVCKGNSCSQHFSSEIKKHLEKNTNHNIESCNCMGHCKNSPNIRIDGKIYNNVTPSGAIDLTKQSQKEDQQDQ